MAEAQLFAIATFNVEWFFLDTHPVVEKFGLNLQSAQEKAHKLAKEISRMEPHPHVVALQELGDQTVVDLLCNALADLKLDYAGHVANHESRRTGQKVGFLYQKCNEDLVLTGYDSYRSRVLLPHLSSFLRNDPPATADDRLSKNVFAHFTYCGRGYTMLNFHLKAQYTESAMAIRIEEAKVAQALVCHLRATRPHNEIIVTGDFNDFDVDVAARNPAKIQSGVLQQIKNGSELRDEIRYRPLTSAGPMIASVEHRWSIIYGDMIDHILTSGRVASCQVFHREEDVALEQNERTSDHFPVLATLY